MQQNVHRFDEAQALPRMRQAGWGRIVTIGSLYSRFGVAHTAPYTSTKHAVLGLTRVLSAEGVKYGVTANCIIKKEFLRNQPLGRMVTTAEVGALAAFRCSDAAAPITGQAVNIDGGSYQA